MWATENYEFQNIEFGDPALGYHSVVNSMDLDDLEEDWGEESWQEWNSPRLYKQNWGEKSGNNYLKTAEFKEFENLVVDDLAALNASTGKSQALSFRFSDDDELEQVIDLRDLIGMQGDENFHIKSKDHGVYFQDISTPADFAKAIDDAISQDIDIYVPREVSYLPSNSAENGGMLDKECRRKNGSKLLADMTRHSEVIDGYPQNIQELEGNTAVITDTKDRQKAVSHNYDGDIQASPAKVIHSILNEN